MMIRLPLPPRLSMLIAVLASVVLTLAGTMAAHANNTAKTRSFTLTFKQLGITTPLTLRGAEGIAGIPFNIRADEVVVAARLRIAYHYSPALLPETSHLVLMLNDEVISSLLLPKAQGSTQQVREFAIDPRIVTEFNRLNVKLIGHYTDQCEDPMHSSLWATVSNQSTLDITVAQINQVNDLALLPRPIFDRSDGRRLVLPFVFGTSPAPSTLEASGTLASWFGALAGYRGAQFPAHLNQLPDSGHAVLFATAQETPAGIVLPIITGPTLSIIDHPKDASSKVLLVMGRDGNELKQAAQALALSNRAMSGATALITELPPARPRLAHDAPNWIATDRPVPLGDLTAKPEMTVNGYSPDLVRVNLRLPPDLFTWRSNGVPLDLKYRYTPRPVPDKSTLNIGVNALFIESIKLPASVPPRTFAWMERFWPSARSSEQTRIKIPANALSPNSQLQFHYQYEYLKQGACHDTIIENVSGTIDGDSSIDLSGLPHFLAMPDLAVFANSGFPFTRMADLSQSAVILPAVPQAVHVSTYLGLMGRMGESTGYPATGVLVALPSQLPALVDKDLLVIGSERNQPLFAAWRSSLPFSSDGKDQRYALSGMYDSAINWWHEITGQRQTVSSARLTLRQDLPGALLMGFESPLKNGRSVVALQANNEQEYASLLDALLEPTLVRKIQGSVVALRNGQVLMLDERQSYDVGSLPPVLYLQWWLSFHPWLLALLAGISASLIGIFSFFMLRRRAAQRLDN